MLAVRQMLLSVESTVLSKEIEMSSQLSTITNIVFIDAMVPDYQTLIEGLPNNSTYFVLDAQKDRLNNNSVMVCAILETDSLFKH